jgi:trigger factor
LNASVAELVDALDLGSSGATRGGSTPFARTNFKKNPHNFGDEMSIETIHLTKPSEHERELTITIAQTVVNQEFNQAVNAIQRVATRPGFRPGKMPKNMVLSFYGNEIKQKLIEKLFEKSFDDACKSEALTPVSQPRMEPVSHVDSSKPFTYKAIFQVKPKVEDPQYQGLSVEVKQYTFEESDVDDEINQVRESMATFVEPINRTEVVEGDLVSCHSVTKIDGIINEAYSHDDYAVPLFAENIPADLKAALLGKKVGDVASVTYQLPDEHQETELSGKPCEMILTIKSIKERVLPAVDDNLARDLSDKFSSLDELKESIKLRFTITAKRRNEYYKQDAITKALIQKNPLDVPPALIERMAMSMINRELEAMGEKTASELVKNHWQEMWDSVQERASFRVKAELLFEVLIDKLAIAVSDEEITAKATSLKNISKDDAKYSIQVEKLLNIIEKEASITLNPEPLFKKGQ